MRKSKIFTNNKKPYKTGYLEIKGKGVGEWALYREWKKTRPMLEELAIMNEEQEIIDYINNMKKVLEYDENRAIGSTVKRPLNVYITTETIVRKRPSGQKMNKVVFYLASFCMQNRQYTLELQLDNAYSRFVQRNLTLNEYTQFLSEVIEENIEKLTLGACYKYFINFVTFDAEKLLEAFVHTRRRSSIYSTKDFTGYLSVRDQVEVFKKRLTFDKEINGKKAKLQVQVFRYENFVADSYQDIKNLVEYYGFEYPFVKANTHKNHFHDKAMARAYSEVNAMYRYFTDFFGMNTKMMVSINAFSAALMADSFKKVYGYTNVKDVQKNVNGMFLIPDQESEEVKLNKNGKKVYPMKKVSNRYARFAVPMFREAYHGGLNTALETGYFTHETYDVDMVSAYVTIMSSMADLDYRRVKTVKGKKLTLNDISSPLIPFAGRVKFRFPENSTYCIPAKTLASLSYFKETDDVTPTVVACGPEIYLALKQGCEVFCEEGYIVKNRKRKGQTINTYMDYFKGGVKFRSFNENFLSDISPYASTAKLLNNGIYGKTAQGISYENDRRFISSISNPVVAAMTTSFARAVLIATVIESRKNGKDVYSITTDGFITNADLEEIKSYKLFGFADILNATIKELYDGEKNSFWDIKHFQTDLLVTSTNTNLSMQDTGVIARGNVPRRFKKKSLEDRKDLQKTLYNGKGKVSVEYKNKETGSLEKKTVNINYDYNMKPIKPCYRYDKSNGKKKRILSFKTTGYSCEAEKYIYQNVAKSFITISTIEDIEEIEKVASNIYKTAYMSMDPIAYADKMINEFRTRNVCA